MAVLKNQTPFNNYNNFYFLFQFNFHLCNNENEVAVSILSKYKMSKKIKDPEKELITAYEFARRKGVEPPAVYYRINKTKEIGTISIGKRRSVIDWEKFKHIEFPNKDRFKPIEEPAPEHETEAINLG